ncbi:MAG: M43 family zinc metalloprotease [Flavobacteriales bacterium]
MTRIKHISLLLFGLMAVHYCNAQTPAESSLSKISPCGSSVKKGLQLAAVMKMMSPPNECNFTLKAHKEFQVYCHISRDSVSTDLATSVDQIQLAIDSLNTVFDPVKMSFNICAVDTLANTRYYDWDSQFEESYALTYNYVPGVINMYFCNSVETDEGLVGGYAMFPGGADIIVMSCANDGEITNRTIIHEMGHFFGLFHTFETEFGEGLVDGTDCDSTGDLVCDTEADHNQTYFFGECDAQFEELDSAGNWYTPPVDNFMSYYNNCTCRFTIQQYNRMVEMYLQERSYLW